MPKFKVTKGHDAWVYYETIVEAASEEEAAEIAGSRDYDGHWEPAGDAEFDAFDITDVEPVTGDQALEFQQASTS